MRASSTSATSDGSGSPVSGSVTGFFNYAPAYITEIDFEMEGCSERSPITQLTSWVNENLPNEHTNVSASGLAPEQGFFTYKFVWMPGKIEFYRDNVLIGTHTKVVPTDPAAVMLNHWGTNNQDWGGVGSPGITRYMWVKSFKYTPL
jgi:beta-glucanase (GH16 family)